MGMGNGWWWGGRVVRGMGKGLLWWGVMGAVMCMVVVVWWWGCRVDKDVERMNVAVGAYGYWAGAVVWRCMRMASPA